MAEKKYNISSTYITYSSRLKSGTKDGVAMEATQLVDLDQDKLQSDINKELYAEIKSASGNTYTKSEIDSKDSATLASAKSYADTKKTEAVSAAATDAATKANKALADAKSYADTKVSALGAVYKTKGSITAANLKALTSAAVGDVYNVTDAVTIDGKAYPAGVNVVCVTAFSTAIDPANTKNWDALQGIQDLSGYALTSKLTSVISGEIELVDASTATESKVTMTYGKGYNVQPASSTITIAGATTSKAGAMSAADKTKLDGLSNYSLPTASAGVKGGVKIGSGISVSSDGTISIPTNTFSNGNAISVAATGTNFAFNLNYDAAYFKLSSENQLTLDLTKLKSSNGLGIDDINSAITADGGEIAALQAQATTFNESITDLKSRVTALEGYLTLA